MVEVLVDGRFELGNGGEDAASDAVLGDQAEEALDLIEPGGRGGGEVQVKARVLGQPCLNVGMLVRSVVVEDQVEIMQLVAQYGPAVDSGSGAAAAQPGPSGRRWR